VSFTADLLDGLAQMLADAGVGVWRPTGAYAAAERAIVIGAMPPEPDAVIVLASFPVDDDPSLSDSVVGVQVRCRGLHAASAATDSADAVFDLWHGAAHLSAGGVRIVQALRQSSATPFLDETARRWETSDNYYLSVHRPSANRT
jgi:hypothetical protein